MNLKNSTTNCDYILLKEYEHLNLICNVTESIKSDSVVWFKENVELKFNNRLGKMFDHINKNYAITTLNNSSLLTIFNPNDTDIAFYDCYSKIIHQNKTIQLIHLHRFVVLGRPWVVFGNGKRTIRSVSVPVNEPWHINCSFYSNKYQREAELKLYLCLSENCSITESILNSWNNSLHDRIKITVKQINGTLVADINFTQVIYSDRGYIACLGANPIAQDKMIIMLRVKDQNEVLWPMIVAVTLMLYCFAIIVIYENRRIRPVSFIKIQ